MAARKAKPGRKPGEGSTTTARLDQLLKGAGNMGAKASDLSKATGKPPGDTSSRLSQMWKRYEADRQPEPGSSGYRYFYRPDKGRREEEPERHTVSRAAHKQRQETQGLAGLVGSFTDYLADEQANREKIRAARALLLQAAALLAFAEEDIELSSSHDDPPGPE